MLIVKQTNKPLLQDYYVFLWGYDSDTWGTLELSRVLIWFRNTLENDSWRSGIGYKTTKDLRYGVAKPYHRSDYFSILSILSHEEIILITFPGF